MVFIRRARALAIALCLLAALSPFAQADTDPYGLGGVSRAEEQQKASLAQLAAQRQQIEDNLNALKEELRGVRGKRDEARNQIRLLSAKLAEMALHDAQLEVDYNKRAAAFASAAKARYQGDPDLTLEMLLTAKDFSGFLDRLAYLDNMASYNAKEAKLLKDARVALDKEKKAVVAIQKSLDGLIAELAAQEAIIAAQYDTEAARAAAIDAQARAEQKLLAELGERANAAREAAKKGTGKVYGPICPVAPPGQVIFCGHGFGHGVGLAQYGALGMAQAGFRWQDILKHFYVGAAISPSPTRPVRAWLTEASGQVTPLLADASVQDPTGATLGQVPQGSQVSFALAQGGVRATWAQGSAAASALRVVPSNGQGTFQTGGSGKRYRGEAWVVNSGGLKVINHVDSEAYVDGLAEVPSSWPMDALKAQMVAARTYALYHLGSSPDYDVDDTTRFQVYGGVDSEAPSQTAAVTGTEGQTLTYGGKLIDAFFSSSDGGHSQCASAEWGAGDTPCSPSYLQGVIDDFDVSPLHTWYTPAYTYAQVQGFLGRAYDAGTCGALTGFDLSSRDASNRLNTVRMVGSKGACQVSPGAFMRAFNAGSPPDATLYGDMFGITPGHGAWPYW